MTQEGVLLRLTERDPKLSCDLRETNPGDEVVVNFGESFCIAFRIQQPGNRKTGRDEKYTEVEIISYNLPEEWLVGLPSLDQQGGFILGAGELTSISFPGDRIRYFAHHCIVISRPLVMGLQNQLGGLSRLFSFSAHVSSWHLS